MIHAPRQEVLRYLGYRGMEPEGQVAALIDARTAAVEGAAVPRWTALELPLALSQTGAVLGTWEIQSQKLATHLEGCTSALLFAATLGVEVDRLIARSAAGRVAQAAVDQAAAAALIEAVCDDACHQLAGRYPGQYLRPRFSPGYGDFPLSAQPELLARLDAPRKIGLTATSAHLLAPVKSVTAVIGVAPTPGKCHAGGCATCSKENCTFRR
ncbi:Vitamin B12 dependent methionine synthase activation subunit [Pseudoflavonifractor phocaeensis]|uniref:Vitamin B12 dependent methionine synthase activation subunit n=1 Tax=Pseudoflavonifractor phocaeensis TaxID=1870988 RepID=UPI00195880D4|nr:Vitamin B12 dependent methionine synthase activation subunit [Pseudoflavonifractor phocaeensis]MBM6924791.1 Vitamin B12 dependent methionine synthase activation subunit [Pseudoflavonifractor phocaeensis]